VAGVSGVLKRISIVGWKDFDSRYCGGTHNGAPLLGF